MGTGIVKKKKTNHTEETGIRVVRRRILQEDPQGDRLSSASFWWMTGLCFLSTVALCMLFTKAFSITFAKWLVYPAMLVYCVLFTLYYEQRQLKKYCVFLFLGVIFVLCLVMFLIQKELMASISYVWMQMAEQLNRSYQGDLSVPSGAGNSATLFFLFLFLGVVWILAQGMIKRHEKGYFLLITFPVLLVVLLSGGNVSKAALFLLILSFLCITAASGIRVRKKFWGGEESEAFCQNLRAVRRIQSRASVVCIAAGTILLLTSFYLLGPVLSKPIVTLSDVSAPVKVHGMQFLYDFLPKISGGKLNLSLEGVGGGVSDGELGDVEGSSYDGIESIRVTTSAQPKEVLYLKGFVGSEYTGDSWKPGDEDALQDAALNWKTEGNSLLYLQNLPFLRMMYTQTQQPEQMTVERLNANTKYTYVPYQAYMNDYYEMIGGDGSVAGQTAQDDSYAWFPVTDFQKEMTEWAKQDDQQSVLDEVETSYEVYVENNYEDVPSDLKQLKKMCKEKKAEWKKKMSGDITQEQKDDLVSERITDVKQFIRQTLWKQCSFSESVKKLPEGEDYVEYFLFDRKKGDSTAFASAAALMFRECGVPARYVVGYAAPANLFTENSEGNYSAVLQDDNAHAWVEIYVPGAGWMPVETTPGFDGTIENVESTDVQTDSVEDQKDKKEEKKNWKEEAGDLFKDTKKAFSGKTVEIVSGILLFLLLVEARRRWISGRRRGNGRKLSKEQKVKEIFCSFYEVLLFGGFPQDVDTTEEEFEREVALRYPEFTEKELEKFRTLVLQVHYGYEEISEQDVQFARDEYEKLVKATVRQMKFRKKSVFYIWKGF